MAADPLDVISLFTAKLAINMDPNEPGHDAKLERDITAISRIIDDCCGPVVQRTITNEQHDGGRNWVQLRRRPVESITSVEEARHGSVETLTAREFGETGDGFFAPTWNRDPTLRSGYLHRVRYGCDYRWWPGSNTVQVTYVAGRFEDTESVDRRFAECASVILRRLWKRESGTWARSPEFFEDLEGDAGVGFFRVAKPHIEELLWDEMQTQLVGFA